MELKAKKNIHILWWGIGIISIVLIVSLSVGTTFARYSTQIMGDKGYVAEKASSPYIVDFDEDGKKIEFVPKWLTKGGEQYLTLTVSNCNVGSEIAPSTDARFRIRVFVPEKLSDEESTLAISDVGNLSMTLQEGDNPTVCYSRADYLSTQTPIFKEKSENGWFFTFFQTFEGEDGVTIEEEMSYLLKGGQISDISFTLTVQNTVIDCSGFKILVDRI